MPGGLIRRRSHDLDDVDRSGLVVFAPLGIEAWLVRRSARHACVIRTGMGPRKAREAARFARSTPARAFAVLGFCGALDPELRPGEVVVATEVRAQDGTAHDCSSHEILASLLRLGMPARSGVIVSTERIARTHERRKLRATGALAVDMESAWLASAAASRPFAVVRVVVDTPSRELFRIWATVRGGIKACRTLARVGRALDDWQVLPFARSPDANPSWSRP